MSYRIPPLHRVGRRMSQERVLLQTLLWHRGYYVPYSVIVEVLWGDDPDGGPLQANSIIAILVTRLRKRGVPLETRYAFGIMLPLEKEDET